MGRYLSGTEGFSYKYLYGEQSNDLVELAGASGVGASFLKPVFWAWMPAIGERQRFDCVALARAIVAETGAKGEISGVARYPDGGVPMEGRSSGYALEFVQYGMAEQVLEVVRRMDRDLSHPASEAVLVGLGCWGMERAAYPAMLSYVNGYLPEPLRLSEKAILDGKVNGLDDGFGAQLRALRGHEDLLPFMAFQILCHALWHDLPRVDVWELDPAVEAAEFWQDVREWGPEWLGKDGMSAEQRWVWGVVRVFQGRSEEAKKELLAALNAGEPRAARWLSMLAGGTRPSPEGA
jgi:hypothetical protein